MALGWLADSSEAEVRRGLAVAGISVDKVDIRFRHPASNPLWWSSSAFVNDDLVAKFAWSEIRAGLLHREGVLLRRLARRSPGLRLPEIVALSDDPVMVITRRLHGEPLSWRAGSDVSDHRFVAVVSGLAQFLADLHRLPADELVARLPAVTPTAQADTAMLGARYGRLVDERRAHRVALWCDWIDDVLGDAVADTVLLHGDLHGHNQLWDLGSGQLM
ncbi:MAG: phosphotransferase family protein, partial [Phenylobacterium sp.]